MTIGTGIFVSATLLALVWLIERRSAWRRAGKAALCLLALGLLGLGGLVGWDSYKAHRLTKEVQQNERAEAEAVRAGKLNAYLRIKREDTKDQILYLFGEPQYRVDDQSFWILTERSEPAAVEKRGEAVFFDASGRITQVQCFGTLYLDCPPIAGVRIDDTEETVIAKLGEPVAEPKLDKGKKWLKYGPNPTRWNLSVELRKGKVSGLIVRLENANPFDKFDDSEKQK
jgi:hypothetical protein